MRFALPNPESLSNFNQWTDRFAGDQHGHLQTDTGDFVLLRSDGVFSYQMAVVVDDALQNVTDIVRGADLLSNTARQRLLSSVLGYQPLRYLHVPLVLNAAGQKLSKQNGAKPLGTENLTTQLNEALVHLGFNPIQADTVCEFWEQAIPAWAKRFKLL